MKAFYPRRHRIGKPTSGCRRSEIGDLKWSELDTEARTITLPRERTKNHQQHIVPLSDAAMSILASIKHRDRDYVFGRTRAGGFLAGRNP
jgi:integrase